jgi:hypothetical protein
MGLLDDIRAAAVRFDAWAERTGRALREWAGSDDGQLVLAGLHYLSLSSRVAEFDEEVDGEEAPITTERFGHSV